jgi:hypothetical protein
MNKIETILTDCIQDFSPAAGGIRLPNSNLTELGKEVTLLGIKSLLPSINTLLNLLKIQLPNIENYDESKSTNISNKLKELFDRHGSDKSSSHCYHLVYGEVFEKLNISSSLNILEIGLGSQDCSIPSCMSGQFKPGSSIRAYKEFFPNANVYGADIDKNILFSEDRIKTAYVDQLDYNTFDQMHKEFGAPVYDLIIEDGLHSFPASLNTLNFALAHTKKGSVIVLEDLVNREDVWSMVTALLISRGYNAKLITSKGKMLVVYV